MPPFSPGSTLVEWNSIGPPSSISSAIVCPIDALSSSPRGTTPPVPSRTCSEFESAFSSSEIDAGSSPALIVASHELTSISRLWPALAAAPALRV